MRYFSLFTGIGGLDWGLEKMGAECVGYCEIKKTSADIYNDHYPDHRNYGDVTQLDFGALPDFDLLTGGFPCQSFSLAGLGKGFKDRRGKLIFYIYDLIQAKKPKWVVLENVKGLLIHDQGKTYKSVFKMLMSAGYYVRVLLLNALYYGSAQSRERLIFLCQRDKDFPLVKPKIVDDTKRFRDIRDRDEVHFKFIEMTDKNREKIEQKSAYPYCLVGGYDRVPTIMTAISSGGGRAQVAVCESEGRFRLLTELEAERLQGFPDGWTQSQARGARWYALGNAVNCGMSDYLFNDYLKGVWFDGKAA